MGKSLAIALPSAPLSVRFDGPRLTSDCIPGRARGPHAPAFSGSPDHGCSFCLLSSMAMNVSRRARRVSGFLAVSIR